MKTLTAVLFVGGESRRMGVDKATLILNGEPFWTRQLRILSELNPVKLMVSARRRPVWCPQDVEVILDEPPSQGPLSGLVAAFRIIQTTHLLALAIDLPQMTSAHLKKLWFSARPGIGIVPQNGKFLEPLCAIYPAEIISTAAEALSKKDVSLHGLIRALAIQGQISFYVIPKSESQIYRNLNTPKQFFAVL